MRTRTYDKQRLYGAFWLAVAETLGAQVRRVDDINSGTFVADNGAEFTLPYEVAARIFALADRSP